MTINFVTVFEERSGSSYFMDSLNSLPHIQAESERMKTLPSRERQPAWINSFFGLGSPHLEAKGFKTKLSDVVCPDRFRSLIVAHNCRVIYLTRRNLIKLTVSGLNAQRSFEQTGRWNRVVGTESLPPFHVPLEHFIGYLNGRIQLEQNLRDFIATLSCPVLTIAYEELLADRNTVFAETFAFLGARPGPVSSRFLKNTDDDLRLVLLNFSELKDHFRGTEYEPMFD